MRRLHAIAEAISRIGVYGGCTLLILSCFLVAFEILARKLFQFSLQGADELTGYALAISSAWGFAYALFTRSHIRVDALYVMLPARVQAVLDLVSLTAFGALVGMISWRGWQVVQETIRLDAHSSSPLRTPLIVPQGLWFLGLVFFLICIVILLCVTLRAFARGDLAEVRRLAGAPSVQDGAAEEMHLAAEARGAQEHGAR